MNVSVGDWIIKGVKGEYYPCKPDIFAATYEPEALALPPADHLPDAGKMIETAAPVGERDAFEELIEEFEAAAIDKHDCRNPEYKFEHRAYDTACQRYDTARAALSAGDAVDAQRYRWLADCNNYPEAVTLISDGSLTADALGKAIDAAMRKEKP